MCCTFQQNCMEMLLRVAFSNKSERKRMRVLPYFDKSYENVGKIQKCGINAINPENQAKSENCEHTLQKSRDFLKIFKNVQTLRNLREIIETCRNVSHTFGKCWTFSKRFALFSKSTHYVFLLFWSKP